MKRFLLLATASLMSVAFSSQALAGDASRRGRIEFDDLDSKIVKRGDRWLLEVEYEVEQKTSREPVPLEIYITVSERGRTLVDHKGRPIVIRIVLDRPTDRDDDEVEFEGEILTELPAGSFFDPGKLRLHGEISRLGGKRVLARRNDSVSYRRPHRHWRGSVGVGVSVGCVSVGVAF
jgi:hypothetical protein